MCSRKHRMEVALSLRRQMRRRSRRSIASCSSRLKSTRQATQRQFVEPFQILVTRNRTSQIRLDGNGVNQMEGPSATKRVFRQQKQATEIRSRQFSGPQRTAFRVS